MILYCLGGVCISHFSKRHTKALLVLVTPSMPVLARPTMVLSRHGLPLGTPTQTQSASMHLVNFMGPVHKEARLLPSRMPPLPSFPDSLLARPTEQRHWSLYGRNLIREARRGGLPWGGSGSWWPQAKPEVTSG